VANKDERAHIDICITSKTILIGLLEDISFASVLLLSFGLLAVQSPLSQLFWLAESPCCDEICRP
jgi:hypothetical protein